MAGGAELAVKRATQVPEALSALSTTTEQVLSDLKLSKNNKLNYAALILLGKEDKIREYLPQARTVIEYRRNPSQTQHDNRIVFVLTFLQRINHAPNTLIYKTDTC